jgi:hypothetical protein
MNYPVFIWYREYRVKTNVRFCNKCKNLKLKWEGTVEFNLIFSCIFNMFSCNLVLLCVVHSGIIREDNAAYK